MPRIGFSWQWPPETTVYGGWGLFGGGSPNVWLSNSYTNNGVTVFADHQSGTSLDGDTLDLDGGLMNVDGFNMHPDILDVSTTCSARRRRGQCDRSGLRNSVAVPLESRRQAHAALGYRDDGGRHLSRVKDEVLWRDLRLQQVGDGAGRPAAIYGADTSP